MIDHHRECTGMPCVCKTDSWDDSWKANYKPTEEGCTCIHINGVWMTRHSVQCKIHPCVACIMRAGAHVGHIHIEGWGALPEEVRVRTCWSCGKQQYMDRNELWVHVYPARGCELEKAYAPHRPPAHTNTEGEQK